MLIEISEQILFRFKYDLGQKYYAPQVRLDQGLNLWHPDHDSTFHVTKTPALTTRPSVTSCFMIIEISEQKIVGQSC